MRRSNRVAPAKWPEPLDDGSPGNETIDDYDHRHDEQQMDQRASDVEGQEPQNPKDEQNYRYGPKHDGILARSELRLARQAVSQSWRTPNLVCALCWDSAQHRQRACLSF